MTAGNARFQVLGAGLIRMEYSPSGSFEDAPTVNVLDRRFAVPSFHVARSGGWLTIATSAATLRYRLGSGPFTPASTSLRLHHDGTSAAVTPQWENECPFDQVCDAGAATLASGATIATDHSGYDSIAGFVAGLGQANQASADWKVLGAPAGQATVTVRYANYIGALGGPAPRTIDLTVNGTDVQTLTLPATSGWDAWSTVTAKVTLIPGDNTVGLVCAAADSCNVNVDTLSVSPAGSPAPTQPAMNYLGGYTRGFDTATYGPRYTCPAGTPTAAQCTAARPQMHPGILDCAGYRLFDDTQSAVWTLDGWVAQRPSGGDIQDGYLFAHGHDYRQALRDLARLTGPSPLLPQSTFGVWYSDYHPYSTSDYENTLIPAFRANHVPPDTLSVTPTGSHPTRGTAGSGTRSLFPDPQAFLNWAKSQGSTSPSTSTPASPTTTRSWGRPRRWPETRSPTATASSAPARCGTGPAIPQAQSYFTLHQPYESQGVAFWWLDWCCDASTASLPGVTPDSWINHLYAADLANKRQRGFVLSRIG